MFKTSLSNYLALLWKKTLEEQNVWCMRGQILYFFATPETIKYKNDLIFGQSR